MSIKNIKMRDLLGYKGREGLILQGCGGDPQEWVDGINNLFTEENILLEGTEFDSENCAVFDDNGITCIFYEFTDNVKINMGKLAMWRIETRDTFGGTWLSDFVDQKFGGFEQGNQPEQTKPDCPLIGRNGNVYNLILIASETLRQNGMSEQAKEMRERIYKSGSYEEALGIIGEYVNITSAEEIDENVFEERMEMNL